MKILALYIMTIYSCYLVHGHQNSWCKRPSSMSNSELVNSGMDILSEFRSRGYNVPWKSYTSYYGNGYSQGNGYEKGYSYGNNERDKYRGDIKTGNDRRPPLTSNSDDYKRPTSQPNRYTYPDRNPQRPQATPDNVVFLDDDDDDTNTAYH